ncbi:hypothetical protein Plhal304r1_c038g0114761 [Plasmopara halstedii]
MTRKRRSANPLSSAACTQPEPNASDKYCVAKNIRPIVSPHTQISFKEMQRLHAMRMELFGFAGWIASALFYALFLIWAYVPDTTLKSVGFTYFPSKHWAVAVPAMIVVSYLFSIVIYKAVNLMSTPGLASYATIIDTHTVRLPEGTTCFEDDTMATPGIGDISVFEVNRHLFSATSDLVQESRRKIQN